jgi:hypothetical protein
LAEPAQHSDEELHRFAEFVLGSALEVFVNSICATLDGLPQSRALVQKKGRNELNNPVELNEWVKYESLNWAHHAACRQLDDFLTGKWPPTKHDDAHACHFFRDPQTWTAELASAPSLHPNVRPKVNKSLLHLTFSNPFMKSGHVEWAMDYTMYVLDNLVRFFTLVKGERMAEALRKRLLEFLERFRGVLKPIVDRNTRAWLAGGGVPPP